MCGETDGEMFNCCLPGNGNNLLPSSLEARSVKFRARCMAENYSYVCTLQARSDSRACCSSCLSIVISAMQNVLEVQFQNWQDSSAYSIELVFNYQNSWPLSLISCLKDEGCLKAYNPKSEVESDPTSSTCPSP